MSTSRRSYSTTLIYLAQLDLLPEYVRVAIHRSIIWRWKRLPADHFYGHDLFSDQVNGFNTERHYSTIRHFAQNTSAMKAYAAAVRLVHAFYAIVSTCADMRQQLFRHKELILDVVSRVSPVLGMKIPLRLFGISIHTLRHWSRTVRMKCPTSFHAWCRKSYPHQLLPIEVRRMKSMLLSPQCSHWPISSIAWYALRQGIVSASVHTWYRYASLLGIHRPRPSTRKKRHHVGIRVEHPGELFHADVTRFVTSSGLRCCIAIIIDNVSRMVMAVKVATTIGAEDMRSLFLQARAQISPTCIPMLMTDDGSENSFVAIRESDLSRHVIAQKDVHYSNSMIEAFNRILKYNYLYRRQIPDLPSLERAVHDAIHDYNTVRPHHSLKGLTPFEAFAGVQSAVKETARTVAQARETRIQANRIERCGLCP